MIEDLIEKIIFEEGDSPRIYECTRGKLTIGAGINLEAREMPEEVRNFWLRMIVDDIVDILSNAGGVSTTDNEVHVRGGRLDETLFIIDGVATKDPLTGYSANLYINADAIEEMEILTGGFNAEYGQAMSGVVNVKLKEGREQLEGSFKYTSDDIGLMENYGTRRLEFNLGGQSLLEKGIEKLGVNIPGRFFFFLNGYGNVSRTNLPSAYRLYPHLTFKIP